MSDKCRHDECRHKTKWERGLGHGGARGVGRTVVMAAVAAAAAPLDIGDDTDERRAIASWMLTFTGYSK